MLDSQPDPCLKEELHVDSFSFFSPLSRLLHLEGVPPFFLCFFIRHLEFSVRCYWLTVVFQSLPLPVLQLSHSPLPSLSSQSDGDLTSFIRSFTISRV